MSISHWIIESNSKMLNYYQITVKVNVMKAVIAFSRELFYTSSPNTFNAVWWVFDERTSQSVTTKYTSYLFLILFSFGLVGFSGFLIGNNGFNSSKLRLKCVVIIFTIKIRYWKQLQTKKHSHSNKLFI